MPATPEPRNVRPVYLPETGQPRGLRLVTKIAFHVQAATALPVNCALLFSSIAAVTGPAGSANYAAANASVDAIAHNLQSQGACAAPKEMLNLSALLIAFSDPVTTAQTG